MKKEDWDKLCRNIFEKKCILLIGPEFPLHIKNNGLAETTTFSNLLSNKLLEVLNQHERVPQEIKNTLSNKDVAQLAGDYIKYTESDKKTSRQNLELFIRDFLMDVEDNLESGAFSKFIEKLPFTVVIDTTFGNFYRDTFINAGKIPETSYYNFRGKKVDVVKSFSSESLGSEFSPFLYNLFGSVKNLDSLVLSENDLIEFVINLISKNPGLPSNVKSELADPDRHFLFLGFGIIAKNWYFRILLQAMESNHKGMSYALEKINTIGIDDDPTLVFFRDELKLSLYHYDQESFIDDLLKFYNEYERKIKKYISEDVSLEGAPKAFISYKSEDFNTAIEICQRLRMLGVDAWIDKERLRGLWDEALFEEINSTDAFILLQSKNLKQSAENYVHEEIKNALKRGNRFQDASDFIYPAFIDDKNSVLIKPSELFAINSYDLTAINNVNLLAKEIRRTYERNKRKRFG